MHLAALSSLALRWPAHDHPGRPEPFALTRWRARHFRTGEYKEASLW